jgi:hypothetical protein
MKINSQEIKSTLNSMNAYYHSVQIFKSFRLLSEIPEKTKNLFLIDAE